jgi:hypothetical protein
MVTPLESGLPRKRKIGSQNPEEESLQLRHDTCICSHRKYILHLNLDSMLSISGVQMQFVYSKHYENGALGFIHLETGQF